MSTTRGVDPRTDQTVGDLVPDTELNELDALLDAADQAAHELRSIDHLTRTLWLKALAARLEATSEELVEIADLETGLGY